MSNKRFEVKDKKLLLLSKTIILLIIGIIAVFVVCDIILEQQKGVSQKCECQITNLSSQESSISDIYIKNITIQPINNNLTNNTQSPNNNHTIITLNNTNQSNQSLKVNYTNSTKPKKKGGGGSSSTSAVLANNPPPTPQPKPDPIIRYGSLRNDSWDNITLPFILNTTNISYIDVAKRSIWHMERQMVYTNPIRPENHTFIYFMKDFQYAFDIIGFTHLQWLYNYTVVTSPIDFLYNTSLNDTWTFQKISRVNGTEPRWDVQYYPTEIYYGSMSNQIHVFLYSFYLNQTIGYPINEHKLNVMYNYINWYLKTYDTDNNNLIETCLKADWRDTCTNTTTNDIENLYENIQLYRLVTLLNQTDMRSDYYYNLSIQLKDQLTTYWDGNKYIISKRILTNESTQPTLIAPLSYSLLLITDIPNQTQKEWIVSEMERVGNALGYQGVITYPCIITSTQDCQYWGENKDFYGELDNAGLWGMYQGFYIEYLLTSDNQIYIEMGLHWLNRYVDQLDHFGFCEANADHCGYPYQLEDGVANPSSILNLMKLVGMISNVTEMNVYVANS